jgi:methylated-DNA-protein-cysteine methyltransferase-like protein
MMMAPSPATLSKAARIEAILALIPAGRVVSYGQVADLAGLPGRARLVGKVLRETDKTLPWHRVLGAGGKISLPKGSAGFDEQTGRLQEEGVPVVGGRVRMREWQWQPDLAELLFLIPF